jgi:hypothetical protein
MKKLILEKNQKVQKMRERMESFKKANSELSQELVNLYKRINLNKKVKLKSEQSQRPRTQPFIESVLYQQSALSAYFENGSSNKDQVIETTDEFKDYLARNGLISNQLRDQEFSPGSQILTMKNQNRIQEGSSFDDLNRRYMKKLRNQNR